MEDEKIIELYMQRSELAITQTVLKYGSYAKKIAFNILRNSEDTEECVYDSYLKLWNNIPPQNPTNLKAFLGKIVRNLSLDKYEKLNSKKRGEGQISLCLSELDECIPDSNNADDKLNEEELVGLINAFLKSQDPKKAKMFIRRYWYIDSINDIATTFACSASSVRTTLHRMREELKEELRKEGVNI